MKKLVCLLIVALLAADAYAVTITPHPTTMTAPGGYVWDPPRIGDESCNILWTSTEHRDIAQIFTPDVDLFMNDFAYRLNPRGGEYAIYIPNSREINVSLYELIDGGSANALSQGTLLISWTDLLTSALNNPAPDSIITFNVDSSCPLWAGHTYAIKFGMASMGGGYLSYGVFGPEAYASAGNRVEYIGDDPLIHYQGWRTGRYAITPEPATLVLLSLGGLLLRRRK